MAMKEAQNQLVTKDEYEINKYWFPVHWASYLINADASGLEAGDIYQCNNTTKDLGICIDVSEETDFRQFKGLGTEVAEFTFIKYLK